MSLSLLVLMPRGALTNSRHSYIKLYEVSPQVRIFCNPSKLHVFPHHGLRS